MKPFPHFLCSLLFCSVAFSDERPNILFAFADDWGHYASAYAALEDRPGPNSVVKTTNFDRIANEGNSIYERVCELAFVHAVPEFTVVGADIFSVRARGPFCRERYGMIRYLPSHCS